MLYALYSETIFLNNPTQEKELLRSTWRLSTNKTFIAQDGKDDKMKTKTVLIILLASLACATFSQARQAELPENFVRLSGQNSVESAIREANSRAENNERFWVGYRTDLRDDLVRKGRVYIHDNGGVSWYHGDENWFWDGTTMT